MGSESPGIGRSEATMSFLNAMLLGGVLAFLALAGDSLAQPFKIPVGRVGGYALARVSASGKHSAQSSGRIGCFYSYVA